jgi:hypothetical protein
VEVSSEDEIEGMARMGRRSCYNVGIFSFPNPGAHVTVLLLLGLRLRNRVG